MIGGAPVTQQYADEIGADGYGENATAAVQCGAQVSWANDGPHPTTACGRPGRNRRRLGEPVSDARGWTRRIGRRLEPLASGARRGSSARLRRGGQPGHPDQHVPLQPHHAGGARAGRRSWTRSTGPAWRSRARAAAGRAAVFASIGPDGEAAGHRRDHAGGTVGGLSANRSGILAAAGADAIVIETMGDLAETKLAVAAARQTGLPVVACMVFDTGKNKDRTMMGTTPEQAAARPVRGGRRRDRRQLRAGHRRLRAHLPPPARRDRPAHLDQGQRRVCRNWSTGVPSTGRRPRNLPAHVPALVEAGASFIGGCCGTTPDYIRAVAGKIQG